MRAGGGASASLAAWRALVSDATLNVFCAFYPPGAKMDAHCDKFAGDDRANLRSGKPDQLSELAVQTPTGLALVRFRGSVVYHGNNAAFCTQKHAVPRGRTGGTSVTVMFTLPASGGGGKGAGAGASSLGQRIVQAVNACKLAAHGGGGGSSAPPPQLQPQQQQPPSRPTFSLPVSAAVRRAVNSAVQDAEAASGGGSGSSRGSALQSQQASSSSSAAAADDDDDALAVTYRSAPLILPPATAAAAAVEEDNDGGAGASALPAEEGVGAPAAAGQPQGGAATQADFGVTGAQLWLPAAEEEIVLAAHDCPLHGNGLLEAGYGSGASSVGGASAGWHARASG